MKINSSLALSILAALLPSTPISAADRIWNGGGNDNFWGNPANWGGTAPIAGDSLFFGGNIRVSPVNDFATDTLFGAVTINNPSGPFTLSGNRILLGGDLSDNMPLVPQTITLPLRLPGTRNINVTTDGVLTISGLISGDPAAGITKNGNGQLILTGANTLSGRVTINAGTLSVASDGNLGSVPGTVTPASITINGGALRTTSTFTLNANRGIALGPLAAPGAGTFTVASGTTLSYSGIIANNTAGTGGLIKNAFGGLTLSGANTYTGPTIIQNGTLMLDFASATAPVDNIISSSSSLALGGANAGLGAASFDALTMNGKAGASDSQTFNGTTIDIGPAIIRANSGSGGTVNMILGALVHNAGGILNVVTPTSTGGAGSISTATDNTHGILGGWATVGNGGIFNNITMGTDLASVDGSGNIVPYSAYRVYQTGENLHSFATPATNLRINSSSSGDLTVNSPDAGTVTDVNTINLSETRAMSIVLGNGNTLRLGRFGTIFKSDNANNITWALGSGTTGGANGVQDSGTLTAGGAPDTAGEIVFYMNNGSSQSQGSLNVEAKVTDNGAGPVTLVKAGPASMKLRGHNTFSGGLYLLQGRLQFAGSEIGTGNPDGGGTGPIHVYPGAYIFPSGAGDFGVTGVAISNNFFIAGLGTQQEQVGAIRFGNGIRVAGDVTLTGESRIGGGNAATLPNTGISGKISGPYSLDIGALGTINTHISLFNPANDWSGATTFNARNTATANNVRNGASEVIPHGVGKGNVTLNGNTSSGTITWDLSGFNETINGLLSAGNLAGCIILNNDVSLTSTLTIGDYDQTATFGGVIQNGAAGAGVLALTKIGGGRQTLSGVNGYTGPTTVNGGTLALAGAGSIASSSQIDVNGGALDVSEVTAGFTYSSSVNINNGTLAIRNTVSPGISSLTLNDARIRVANLGSAPAVVETASLTTGGAGNLIDVASIGTIDSYPAQFTIIKYPGAIGGSGFNFSLGNVPTASTIGFISNNVDNSSVDLVLLDGPKSLTWTGVNGNAWDIETTTNWLAFGVTPAAYFDVDSTRFDDSASLFTVNLTTTLRPGAVLVNNETADYIFTGSGKISGPTGLTKQGAGKLTLDHTGANDFLGPVTISGGLIQVGNGNMNGNLGAGSVANESALVFARTDTFAVPNPISGSGSITQDSSGVLTLSGNNTYAGPTVVVQGTLRPGSGTALGSDAGGTIINSGTTLDVNGQNLGAEPVIVSGSGVGSNGAIVNSGGGQNNALRVVTLAGDTVFGGTDRWDIRAVGGVGTLSASGSPVNITKVGPNQVGLVGLSLVDPLLENIDVQAGILSIETTTVQLGESFGTLTVHGGAVLNLFNLNPNPLNKIILLKDGSLLRNENGMSSVSGPIMLESGNVTIHGASSGTTPMFTIANIITGPGNLFKIGTGPVTLAAENNDYSGATTVSNGQFYVDGSTFAGGLITVYGGTLGGVGSIGGSVTITPDGTLAPGNPANPIENLEVLDTLILNGTNVMDLDKANPRPNDSVDLSLMITFGGTLRLNNIGPPLSGGDAFVLYTASFYDGAFANIVPANPGAGLRWDTNSLTVDGTLRVVELSRPTATTVSQSGTNVIVSGSGAEPGAGYIVLASSDVAAPLANWTPIATNTFDGSGNFSFSAPIEPELPQRFYVLQYQ